MGEAREVLRELPEKSVHMIVTSPPYYGLRDYDSFPSVWGGHPLCEHEWSEPLKARKLTGGVGKSTLGEASGGNAISEEARVRSQERQQVADPPSSMTCQCCFAWHGDLGLEPTPEMFVDHLAEVFKEAWRVLRDDGSLWVNMGDSYATTSTYNVANTMAQEGGWKAEERRPSAGIPEGYRAKELMGVPWLMAFRLRRDGWVLRSENVWHKLGAMPESVNDRTTRAHEHIFHFTKQGAYFFDWVAVSNPAAAGSKARMNRASRYDDPEKAAEVPWAIATRSMDDSGRVRKRTVWTMATANYHGKHFAVFPNELPETCIKATTSEKGCCGSCGAPIVRMVEEQGESVAERQARQPARYVEGEGISPRADGGLLQQGVAVGVPDPRTVGWKSSCGHEGEPVPCVVLDPFAGAATTLVMARRLNRRGVGIEISEAYAREEALPRLAQWWKDVRPMPEPPEDQMRLIE